MEAILAKVQEDSFTVMVEYAQDIYNLGNLKVPRESEVRYIEIHLNITISFRNIIT